MASELDTYSPVDGSLYVERAYAYAGKVARVLARAVDAQAAWRNALMLDRRKANAWADKSPTLQAVRDLKKN